MNFETAYLKRLYLFESVLKADPHSVRHPVGRAEIDAFIHVLTIENARIKIFPHDVMIYQFLADRKEKVVL